MPYLGTRNIAIFSTDIDTFDFKLRKPEDVVKSAMTKLAKNGKGIMLMHDFQHTTGAAMPELLRQLKAGGYKIVHMVPKEPVTKLAEYDDMVRARDKYSTSNNARSESSVIKTISECAAECRLLAQSGQHHCGQRRLLSGVKGLSARRYEISAFDP